MKKGFFILIIILFVSLFSRDAVFAQSADTPDVCKTATSDDIKQACADYAAENKKLAALQAQLATQKQKTGGLQKNVNELVAKITATQAKIKSQINTIAKLSVEINHKIKVISELGNELDREHASMGQLIKKSDELDRQGATYVLFSANSISSFYQNLDDFFSIKGSLYASVNKVKKLMFIPTANGIKPRTVVIAVSNTGRNLVFPASINAFLISSIDNRSFSSKPNSSFLRSNNNLV